MSWIRNSKRAAVVALALGAACASAGTLVVRSSGPTAKSYPPGMALTDKQKIVLKTNDQVVILDGRGTRTLKGPGIFDTTVSSAASSDSRATFAALVTQRTARRARIGAVRSVAGLAAPRNPNIWYIDIERSGTVCVADPAALTLWRPDMTGATIVTVKRRADGRSEKVAWVKGQSALSWPASLPATDNAEYQLNWAGAAQPTNLRLALLGPRQEGLENTAADLIRRGCNAQLDLLIETLAVPSGAVPAG